ncbi:MAG: hypothetical protein ACQEXJ_00375 [Myxococcota bacterium]
MKDRKDWITIEVDDDARRLRRDADRLRLRYRDRYDFRIAQVGGDKRYALRVRHRD